MMGHKNVSAYRDQGCFVMETILLRNAQTFKYHHDKLLRSVSYLLYRFAEYLLIFPERCGLSNKNIGKFEHQASRTIC